MTVFAKITATITKTPLVRTNYNDELVIDVQPPARLVSRVSARSRITGVLFCMFLCVFLLALLGVLTARQIYKEGGPARMHYQGYCTIPYFTDMRMPEPRRISLTWQDAFEHSEFRTLHLDQLIPELESTVGREQSKTTEVDVAVTTVGKVDGDTTGVPAAVLSELLDINVDEALERIAVYHNGQPVSFLHDFETNVTGIVDSERCFLMDMEADSALAPQLFVLGLQRGREFDVELVNRHVRALWPAVLDLSLGLVRGLAARCADRPTYRLERDNATVIRKRAAEEPQYEYIVFAGNNVQQIEITNLPALLHHEQGQHNPA